MAFKVVIGESGLQESHQAKFPSVVMCDKCRCDAARHAFTVIESYSGTVGEEYVCNLHKNNRGGMWLRDCCAVAIYFCSKCLEVSARYNQA